MNQYQIVVSFEAESDEKAIEVMEYLDADLDAAGHSGVAGFETSLPKRFVPSTWGPLCRLGG